MYVICSSDMVFIAYDVESYVFKGDEPCNLTRD